MSGIETQGPTEFFTFEQVIAMRSRASGAREVDGPSRKGWFKSDVDPMRLLEAFPAISLHEDFVLRAYRWCDHDGAGRIWAMPRASAFPEPNECPWWWMRKLFFLPPRPASVCGDLMQEIIGDASPLSYLSASLFAREAAEFGAMWHLLRWSTCTVMGADPWDNVEREGEWWPSSDESRWRWYRSRPVEWRPSVAIHDGRAIVTLIVFCGYGTESILELTDTYRAGSYRFKTKEVLLAQGPVATMF